MRIDEKIDDYITERRRGTPPGRLPDINASDLGDFPEWASEVHDHISNSEGVRAGDVARSMRFNEGITEAANKMMKLIIDYKKFASNYF